MTISWAATPHEGYGTPATPMNLGIVASLDTSLKNERHGRDKKSIAVGGIGAADITVCSMAGCTHNQSARSAVGIGRRNIFLSCCAETSIEMVVLHRMARWSVFHPDSMDAGRSCVYFSGNQTVLKCD